MNKKGILEIREEPNSGIIERTIIYKDALNDDHEGKVIDKIKMKVQYQDSDDVVVVTGYLVEETKNGKVSPVPYYAVSKIVP